jgi:hypothetical protein
MKKFNATRTIIQVATIEAESVEDARAQVQADSEAVSWRDTSNRFMVFENLSKPPPNDMQSPPSEVKND